MRLTQPWHNLCSSYHHHPDPPCHSWLAFGTALFCLTVQNGVLILENRDSAVAAGGSRDSSREVQDKLERRRKQKRDSARRVRGNQKQDFLRLQRVS